MKIGWFKPTASWNEPIRNVQSRKLLPKRFLKLWKVRPPKNDVFGSKLPLELNLDPDSCVGNMLSSCKDSSFQCKVPAVETRLNALWFSKYWCSYSATVFYIPINHAVIIRNVWCSTQEIYDLKFISNHDPQVFL